MTKNKYRQLLILCVFCGLSGAWKTNFKITNKFGGDGSELYPASEKDNAYLFCENDEDAGNSKAGRADWSRSKSHDYCWNEHRGSDDTWRSGWERSRLMRGCKNQLNFFGNKIYRCFDAKKNPEFLQIEQSLTDEKKQDYEQWLTIYQAKVEDLSKGANQTFGDVDAALKVAQENEAKKKQEKEKLEKDTPVAKQAIADLSARHAQMDKLLSSLVGQFDTGWKNLLAKVDKLAADIDATNTQISSVRSQLKASDQSFPAVSAIQTAALPGLNKSYATLCKGLEIDTDIENLRSQVGYMNRLIAPLLADAEAVDIPKNFADVREDLLAKINSLFEVSGKRDFIFDSSYDVFSESPSVCAEVESLQTQLGEAVAYAKKADELKKTIGVIVDLEAMLKMFDEQYEADAQYNAALSTTRGIESQWTEYLQKGRIALAKETIDNLDQSIVRIMSAPALTASKADLNKLGAEIGTWKARMLQEASYRISLNAANGLLYTKGRQIKLAIIKLELKSKRNPQLNTVWSLQKQDIFSTFNTQPGQEIDTPVFTDWPSILAYEQMVDSIAKTMDQLLLQNP